MALTANVNRWTESDGGPINEFGVKATEVIFEGSAVGSTGGYARALVAGDVFLGFALHAITGNAADGGERVRVRGKARIQLPVTSVAVTDIGAAVFASDDGTFTLTATSNSFVGTVHRFVSTGIAIVDVDTGNQAVYTLGIANPA